MRRHPYKVLQGKRTAEAEGLPFRWAFWNTGIGIRLKLLQLPLSVFSRKGWRKFGQKSFPISPIDWTLISFIFFPYSKKQFEVPRVLFFPTKNLVSDRQRGVLVIPRWHILHTKCVNSSPFEPRSCWVSHRLVFSRVSFHGNNFIIFCRKLSLCKSWLVPLTLATC